jgi:hypothetical protein
VSWRVGLQQQQLCVGPVSNQSLCTDQSAPAWLWPEGGFACLSCTVHSQYSSERSGSFDDCGSM